MLDLGAAPGSWSQVAFERVGPTGKVVAVDLQIMGALPGVDSFVGDIRDPAVITSMRDALGQPADVVLSDIAPQASGVGVVDQARSIELAETALAIATKILRLGGVIVVKVFRGEDFDKFIASARGKFHKVNVVIPEATRPESRESFVVAQGFGYPEPPRFLAVRPRKAGGLSKKASPRRRGPALSRRRLRSAPRDPPARAE